MRIVRCIGWAGLAALMAGCGSTPAYYTQRVTGAPSAVARAAPETRPASESAAPRRATRETSAAPRMASRTQVSSPRSGPDVSSSRAIDNTGAAATAPVAEQTRAEREQRARSLHDRREEALKRSMNSICRGC